MSNGLVPENSEFRRTSSRQTVRTDAWQITVPDTVTTNSPLLVIPTVHPRGDRRIIRCAQVALDSGFRVHFLWLGTGETSQDPRVKESLFPEPRTAFERIRMVTDIAKFASHLEGVLWHIHDFYFLGAAKKWARKNNSKALYDVHEYYGRYYADKMPIPSLLKRIFEGMIENYQVRATKVLGAANVVSKEMAASFRNKGIPVIVSPNYPLLSHFDSLPSISFKDRRWKVLHIGTLSRGYGTELLIQLAARSLERGLPFEFSVIERFPSPNHARDFEELLVAAGTPRNLEIIPARPTHEMPDLLKQFGFGLSLLMECGQNELAVASKLYEHVMAGMVVVVSGRKAQRDFATEYAVHVSVPFDNADAILDEMICIAENSSRTDLALTAKASIARNKFTWERAVEPNLHKLLHELYSGK